MTNECPGGIKMDQAFIENIMHVLETLPQELKGVIFFSEEEDFGHGMDQEEFRSMQSIKSIFDLLFTLIKKIQQQDIVTICLVRGKCFGEFFEFALACDYLFSTSNEKCFFSMNQISQGYLPFAGSLSVLPKKIGLQAALDLFLTARALDDEKAQRYKIITKILNLAMGSSAIDYLLQNWQKEVSNISALESFTDRIPKWAIEGNPLGRKVLFKKAKEKISDKSGDLQQGIGEDILQCLYKEFEEGLSGQDLKEFVFIKLQSVLTSASYKARRYHWKIDKQFSLYEDQKHSEEQILQLPDDKHVLSIVGSNCHAKKFVIQALLKNFIVKLCTKTKEEITDVLNYVRSTLIKLKEKRLISSSESKRIFLSLHPSYGEIIYIRSLAVFNFYSCEDLFFDFESFEKKPLFICCSAFVTLQELRCKNCDLTVCFLEYYFRENTANVLEYCAKSKLFLEEKERFRGLFRVLGAFYFDEVGKEGFLTQKILTAFCAGALSCYLDGGKMEVIEKTLSKEGYQFAVFEMMDAIGVDNLLKMAKEFSRFNFFSDKMILLLEYMVSKHYLGKSTGVGFYDYRENSIKKENEDLINKSDEFKELRYLNQTIILDRIFIITLKYILHILEQDRSLKNEKIDFICVNNCGFPQRWGGVLYYLETLGVENVEKISTKLNEVYKDKVYIIGDLLEKYLNKN